MMRKLSYVIDFLAILAFIGCTDFREVEAPASFDVTPTEMIFTSSGGTGYVTISSGTRWDILNSYMPEWMSLSGISQSGLSPYEWTVSFTASANNDYNRRASITFRMANTGGHVSVHVTQEGKKGEYVAVESISISPSELTLTEGEYTSISYKIEPSTASVKNISWSTKDNSIASVDATGIVTAISEGTTTITATSEDGRITATCLVNVIGTHIDIPDANFRKYIVENFDLNKDGTISLSEAKKITSIDVHSDNIKSLQGIEYFENLGELIIWGYAAEDHQGQLSSLDVSNNLALTKLDCAYNKLSYLDVSNNVLLKKLDCSGNQLSSIDISRNIALTSFNCGYNQLTAIDVSNNPALQEIVCQFNQLNSIDLSNNLLLESFGGSGNQFNSLDVTKNQYLKYLLCAENNLKKLDLSKNMELAQLWCDNNQLTKLDVSKNTKLNLITCKSNYLTTLDVTKNTALSLLDCRNNSLEVLDLSKNLELHSLDCSGNVNLSYIYLAQGQDINYIVKDHNTQIVRK